MKKAIGWFLAWASLLVIGSVVSFAYIIYSILRNGAVPVPPPYDTFQQILLYLFFPFTLLPTSAISCYFSFKENIKPLKIVTIIILIQHIIVLIGLLIQLLG